MNTLIGQAHFQAAACSECTGRVVLNLWIHKGFPHPVARTVNKATKVLRMGEG